MDKYVCAIFLLDSEGRSLLQHRDNFSWITYPNRWTIPGGQKEAHESSAECVVRELFEETTYQLRESDCSLLYHNSSHVDLLNEEIQSLLDAKLPLPKPYTLDLYCAAYDHVQQPRCLEGQDLRFVSMQEAKNLPFLFYLFPFWQMALQRLGKKIIV